MGLLLWLIAGPRDSGEYLHHPSLLPIPSYLQLKIFTKLFQNQLAVSDNFVHNLGGYNLAQGR